MSPGDAAIGTYASCTPALAKAVSCLAAQMPFEAGGRLLAEMTGATVNSRHFHRLTEKVVDSLRCWDDQQTSSGQSADTMYVSFDGTGVPMRREHLVGRKGRDKKGVPKTREVRLGCVFTQGAGQHKPTRNRDSTTYVASLVNSVEFGKQIKAEARRRGCLKARHLVVLTDGARWCQKLAATHFPAAQQILDFYHAAKHVHDLAKAIHGDWEGWLMTSMPATVCSSVPDSSRPGAAPWLDNVQSCQGCSGESKA